MIPAAEFRAREAATMLEDTLLSKVRGLAGALGWLAYHTHDSRRSEPGFPDLVLVKGETVLYRELKTAKGRVSPEQQAWLDALTDTGADVGVWRPQDLLTGAIRRTLTTPRHPATAARLRVVAEAQHKRRRATLRRGAKRTVGGRG